MGKNAAYLAAAKKKIKDRLEAETSTKKSPVKKRISKAQRATLAREEKKTKAAQTIARAAVVVARRANEKARGRARVAEVERSPASSTEILAVPQTRRQPARSLTMSTANPDSSSAVTTGASIQNRDDGALNSDLEGGGTPMTGASRMRDCILDSTVVDTDQLRQCWKLPTHL
ncbi:hypothetical protein L917_17478 [Phytophthora nicotianae]|uniref:Uncharacterized protein n=1 Tax=Phytophthora nicotianae TaxID=4792 RepID=W2KAS8_PHYNI|nr:hypothetical protein L917_17478 [Phytophthora nicotianae]